MAVNLLVIVCPKIRDPLPSFHKTSHLTEYLLGNPLEDWVELNPSGQKILLSPVQREGII